MLLEQPGRIGPLRLKNRVVMAPMGTNYSTTDGLSSERDKLYYAERARGGKPWPSGRGVGKVSGGRGADAVGNRRAR